MSDYKATLDKVFRIRQERRARLNVPKTTQKTMRMSKEALPDSIKSLLADKYLPKEDFDTTLCSELNQFKITEFQHENISLEDHKDLPSEHVQTNESSYEQIQEEETIQEQIQVEQDQEEETIQEQIQVEQDQEEETIQEQIQVEQEQEEETIQEQIQVEGQEQEQIVEQKLVVRDIRLPLLVKKNPLDAHSYQENHRQRLPSVQKLSTLIINNNSSDESDFKSESDSDFTSDSESD